MWARVYAFGLMQSLYLDQFLWLVYLLHLGYTVPQIGIGYAVMQAGRFAFDIPSSILADRFGQRPVLVVGAVMKGCAGVLFLYAAQGFLFMVLGCAVTALALTLPSGVDISLVRSLSERFARGDEGQFQTRLSGYMRMQMFAGMGSGLLGGLLASFSFPLLYVVEAIAGGIAAVLAAGLPDGGRPVPLARTRTNWIQALGEIMCTLRSAPKAFWGFGLLLVPLWTFSSLGTEYTQALLRGVALNPFAISLAFTVAGGAAALGATVSGRIGQEKRAAWLRALLWLYPVAALLRAAAKPARFGAVEAAVAGIVLARFGSGGSSVLTTGMLIERAPDSARATALSAVNTIQMGAMMFLFPGLGWIASGPDVTPIFVALGLGLLLVVPAVAHATRSMPAGG